MPHSDTCTPLWSASSRVHTLLPIHPPANALRETADDDWAWHPHETWVQLQLSSCGHTQPRWLQVSGKWLMDERCVPLSSLLFSPSVSVTAPTSYSHHLYCSFYQIDLKKKKPAKSEIKWEWGEKKKCRSRGVKRRCYKTQTPIIIFKLK